jgi:hypothetical protein
MKTPLIEKIPLKMVEEMLAKQATITARNVEVLSSAKKTEPYTATGSTRPFLVN